MSSSTRSDRPGHISRRMAIAGMACIHLEPVSAQQPPGGEEKAGPLPPLGSHLSLPDLTLLDGSRFRAVDVEGHVLVLYWWASWCPFCAQQSPSMDKLWRANRSRGLRMLGLSIDRKADDASRHLQKWGYAFPSGLVTPEVAKVLAKPKGLPVTVVRGRDGSVLAAESGQLFPEDVELFARFL